MADSKTTTRIHCRERKLKRNVTSSLSLEKKVALLREHDAWPDRTDRVDVIETHLSWVFLTTHYAWKLKKPVRYDSFDLRSVAARKRNCDRELRLNRRLSPFVYLRVVPLTLCADGVIRVGGKGKVIDWLLKMRRLSAGLMLDRSLTLGTVRVSDIERLVRKLGTFYQSLPRSELSARSYRAHFRMEIASNESLLGRLLSRRAAEVRQLCDMQIAALARCTDRLELRVADGWIKECHGDLRPEHVCLTKPIAIIDCLEFSERLRTVDTLDEVGFLALEFERLGAPSFGDILLDAYSASMHDPVDPCLLHFYQSVRASVRARLAAAHLLERKIGRVRHWRQRALGYLEIAKAHARQCIAALQANSQALSSDRPSIGVADESIRRIQRRCRRNLCTAATAAEVSRRRGTHHGRQA
jgi:aminoglycoside phosphotransferase family enzyme